MTKMDTRSTSEEWLHRFGATLTPRQEVFVRNPQGGEFIAEPLGGCTHAGIVKFVARALSTPGLHVMIDGCGAASAETARRRVRDMMAEIGLDFTSSAPYRSLFTLDGDSEMRFLGGSNAVNLIRGMLLDTAWLDNNQYLPYSDWQTFSYRAMRRRGQAFYTGGVQWVPWSKSVYADNETIQAYRKRLADAGMIDLHD